MSTNFKRNRKLSSEVMKFNGMKFDNYDDFRD